MRREGRAGRIMRTNTINNRKRLKSEYNAVKWMEAQLKNIPGGFQFSVIVNYLCTPAGAAEEII